MSRVKLQLSSSDTCFRDGEFIAAGSDDGNLFIWDRESTNLIRVIPGDESIVNCVQPHPHTCLLATSGIESVVKLWAPLPQVCKDIFYGNIYCFPFLFFLLVALIRKKRMLKFLFITELNFCFI